MKVLISLKNKRHGKYPRHYSRKQRNLVKKTEMRTEGCHFANHKASSTVIRHQPLQSILVLRSCSAMDLI